MLLFKARLELLKRLDETQLERLVTSRSESIEEESGARWCCAACGNRVTERDQSISIAGKHVHQCTNPDGVLFVIGCFRDVPGCIAVDEPTARFTWFPGYRWQVALTSVASSWDGVFLETTLSMVSFWTGSLSAGRRHTDRKFHHPGRRFNRCQSGWVEERNPTEV